MTRKHQPEYLALITEHFPDKPFTPAELHTIAYKAGIRPNMGMKACAQTLVEMYKDDQIQRVRASNVRRQASYAVLGYVP